MNNRIRELDGLSLYVNPLTVAVGKNQRLGIDIDIDIDVDTCTIISFTCENLRWLLQALKEKHWFLTRPPSVRPSSLGHLRCLTKWTRSLF